MEMEGRTAPLLTPVARLLAAYPRIYFACHTRHVRDPLKGTTLSSHQASILSHLDPIDATTVSQLAGHMGVTVSTMSLAVGRLERQGYVARSKHPNDGRVVELRLTKDGVRVKESQTVLDPDRVEALLERLSPKDREAALAGLAALAGAADELVRAGAGSGWRAGTERRPE